MNKTTLILISAFLVLVVLKVGWWSWQQDKLAASVTANWETYSNQALGFEFKYPKQLATKYIRAQDWPPKVMVASGNFSCNEVGHSNPGQPIVRKTTTSPIFCVTTTSDAAAGSSYTDYSYTTLYNNKLVTFGFVLQQPNNCGPIPEPQRPECLQEETTFSPDDLVKQIFSTLRFTK